MDCIGRFGNSCFVTKPMPICCTKRIKESTSTRLLYCCILIVVSVLSVIFHTGGIAHSTAVQMLDDMLLNLCSRFQTREECVRFVGYMAVYRFCIPLAVFHFILMLIMINNSNSQSWRGKLHNGLWFWKCVFIVGIWVLSIFVPALDKAATAWMLLAVLGGVAFIYLQNVFLIDYAYECNGTWNRRSRRQPRYKILIVALTVSLYAVTFVAYGALWALWAFLNGCALNAVIVYVNLCFTVLLLLLSLLHPRIRAQNLYLPGAVTAAFSAYLTWSAILSQPKSVVRGLAIERQAVQFFNFRRPLNVTLSHRLAMNRTGELMANTCLPTFVRSSSLLVEHLPDVVAALGIVLVIGGSIYSSMRASLQAKRLGIKTRRQKMKAIIKEMLAVARSQEKAQADNPASSPPPAPPQSCNCFSTVRRSKRRRMVLAMLQELVDSDSPATSRTSSQKNVPPPPAQPQESLRRKMLRKRLGLASPASFSELNSVCRRGPLRSGEVEVIAMGEIRPSGDVVGVAEVRRGRRRSLSESETERPVSVCSLPPLPMGDRTDALSVDDIRIEKARKVTEYLTREEGKHLLHENREMADSVASFAEILMPKRAPRDRFTIYNEAILTVYSYAWFHFTFCLATLYVTAQLTNWYNPELSSLQTVMESWANMWMKLFSALLALLLYLWTLCFMRFCFNRSLIQTPLNPATHWVCRDLESTNDAAEGSNRLNTTV